MNLGEEIQNFNVQPSCLPDKVACQPNSKEAFESKAKKASHWSNAKEVSH